MRTVELINQKVQNLPEEMQVEILTFVEFLYYKANLGTDVDSLWTSFSLNSAMQGMESEDLPEYVLDDLRERFSWNSQAR